VLSNVLLKLSSVWLVFGAISYRMRYCAWGLFGVLMYKGVESNGGIPAVLSGADSWPTITLGFDDDRASLLQRIVFDIICSPCINFVNHLASLSPSGMLFLGCLTVCIYFPSFSPPFTSSIINGIYDPARRQQQTMTAAKHVRVFALIVGLGLGCKVLSSSLSNAVWHDEI
jgi:hypothetical protein